MVRSKNHFPFVSESVVVWVVVVWCQGQLVLHDREWCRDEDNCKISSQMIGNEIYGEGPGGLVLQPLASVLKVVLFCIELPPKNWGSWRWNFCPSKTLVWCNGTGAEENMFTKIQENGRSQ